MTFIRFDVIAFTWMLIMFLSQAEVAVLPRKPALALLGILLGLMLFVILVSTHAALHP